jgi:hypothetical protein
MGIITRKQLNEEILNSEDNSSSRCYNKVTILEPHVYSIRKWNESKHHKDPETFEEQADQIYKLNGKVREINSRLETHSPEFSSDIQTSKKHRCGKNRTLRTEKSYNFTLYKDGIHPGDLLSKAWLKKIAEQSKKDCWEQTTKTTPT